MNNMRARPFRLIAIATILSVAAFRSDAPARGDGDPRCTVNVRVVDSENRPIQGAFVELQSPDRSDDAWELTHALPKVAAAARTDTDGSATISATLRGVAHLRATSSDFIVVRRTCLLEYGRPAAVVLRTTRGHSISGVVTDEDHCPADNVVVVVGPIGFAGHLDSCYQFGQTDSNGKYSIHGLPPGVAEIYSYRALSASTLRARLRIPQPSTFDFLAPKGGKLVGRVIDAATKVRVPNLRLRASGVTGEIIGEAQSNGEGEYTLFGYASLVNVARVTAVGVAVETAADPAADTHIIPLARGATVLRDVLVDRGASSLECHVVASGQPVPNVAVAVTCLDTGNAKPPQFRARTDPLGVAQFSGMPTGDSIVRILSTGLRQRGASLAWQSTGAFSDMPSSAHVVLSGGRTTVTVEVELLQPTSASVHLIGDSGHPVAMAVAELAGRAYRADTDGVISIPRLAGDLDDTVTFSGHELMPQTMTLGEILQLHDLQLHRAKQIRISVVDARSSSPCVAAVTVVTPAGEPGALNASFPTTIDLLATGRDGVLEIELPSAEGSAKVTASVLGLVAGEAILPLSVDSRSVRLALARAQTIDVTVLDAVTEIPVPRARVFDYHGSLGVSDVPAVRDYYSATSILLGLTNSMGRLTVDRPDAGTIHLRVSAVGYRDCEETIDKAQGSPTILLSESLTLSGLVVLDAPLPNEGLLLDAIRVDATEDVPTTTGLFRTTKSGEFAIDNLTAGKYWIEVVTPDCWQGPDIAPERAGPFDAGDDSVQLHVRPGRKIHGAIVDDFDIPISATAVTARPWPGDRGLVYGRASADSMGTFQIAHAPYGPVFLTIEAQLPYPLSRRIVRLGPLDPGATPLRVIVPRGRVIEGVLRRQSGDPAAGIAITAVPAVEEHPDLTSACNSCITDDVGRFAIGGLQDGAYHIWGTRNWKISEASLRREHLGRQLDDGSGIAAGQRDVVVKLHW